ncbi:paired small multidrug resistance pump [Scopulibacillus darangshiensis]|uniref:Paired small multidrug resistance pump n=1 Tax=Scopulibacillus darangshiensis TaxID=442528 RepID=A0A4R2P6X7_9BACL|nr:multidrug efflux SMR transporter [Scopulibacillus darangshiensis]TCP30622.1 paired small multidrug resistance pump [Scopulibacillus darangshiensis]
MMNWFLIFLAGLLEIVWAIGLKYADSFLTWAGVVLTILISFFMIIHAFKTIPVTLGYTVFVGIGAIGTFITGFFLKEPVSLKQIIFLIFLLVGVIGIKVSSERKKSASKGGNK